jgi:poly-beta-1,6-N-acetyl-D-glucosamine synthase
VRRAVLWMRHQHWVRLLLAGALTAIAFNVFRWRHDVRTVQQLRRQADRPVALHGRPRVSVLVAAWNEHALVQRHIESVRRLRYADLEHVLCAGGADGTFEIAQRLAWPGLILLRQQDGEGVQNALARCLQAATGDIAFFTDADCVLEDSSFERLIAPIVNEGEGVTTGPYRPLPEQMCDAFIVHRWAATTYRLLQAGAYVEGVSGANAAILIEPLRRSGALTDTVWHGWDLHVARQMKDAGYPARFVHSSELATAFEPRFTRFVRQRSRWLAGILAEAISGRDLYQVLVVGSFYAVGQCCVWLPVMSRWSGGLSAAVWLSGVFCAVLNRIRYLAFTSARTGQAIPLTTYVAAVWLVPRDLLALAYAPIDLLLRLRSNEW